jgi:tryptophanyl-tRNA synthetase
MKALTDSENAFYYDPENKPGLSNLINIYSALSGQAVEEVVEQYRDSENYGVFKRALCELLEKELLPIQERVKEIKESKFYERVLEDGSYAAQILANEKMTLVYKNLGIYE